PDGGGLGWSGGRSLMVGGPKPPPTPLPRRSRTPFEVGLGRSLAPSRCGISPNPSWLRRAARAASGCRTGIARTPSATAKPLRRRHASAALRLSEPRRLWVASEALCPPAARGAARPAPAPP